MQLKSVLKRIRRTEESTSTSGNMDVGGVGGGRMASIAAAVADSTSMGASTAGGEFRLISCLK
jgi:hypothetical protein